MRDLDHNALTVVTVVSCRAKNRHRDFLASTRKGIPLTPEIQAKFSHEHDEIVAKQLKTVAYLHMSCSTWVKVVPLHKPVQNGQLARVAGLVRLCSVSFRDHSHIIPEVLLQWSQ